jgi:hypothetical protein
MDVCNNVVFVAGKVGERLYDPSLVTDNIKLQDARLKQRLVNDQLIWLMTCHAKRKSSQPWNDRLQIVKAASGQTDPIRETSRL